MSELFNVIFRGDILPGHSLPVVKAQMAQLFKLDDAKLAAVFSGKPVTLKKDCDATTAEKVKAALTKIGADSEIKSASTPVATAAPAPTRPVSSPPASPAVTTQSTPVPAKPVPPGSVSPQPINSGIKLAPVGQVLTEAERAALRKPPVQVKTEHISLEKKASSFGAAEDKPVAGKLPEIKAPDFGVAPMSGDLLKDNEKRVYETLEIDLSNFKVAELGADIMREDEKLPLPVMEIEELNADLAPVGSDMAQLKKPAPPPPPKVDHIRLA